MNSDNEYIVESVDGFDIFGFTLKQNNKNKKQEENKSNIPLSFAEPSTDDGSAIFISAGSHQIAYHDLGDYSGKSDISRILKYREISNYPECDQAIEEIINEMVVIDDEFKSIELIIDEEEISKKLRETIQEEFDGILSLLSFSINAYDIVRKWYVDGRLVFHMILDKNGKELVEIRPVDPIFIKKVKEVVEKPDPTTGAKVYQTVEEYFIYSETQEGANTGKFGRSNNQALKISKDAIVYVPSGLLDETRKNIISYLHKAIKPINQLRMLEDSLVIYRLVRAPERRVFKVDVGGLPSKKAESYIENVIAKYRNKVSYNAETGELSDSRQTMAMIEDFWLPTREGRGTDIETLSGGDNLSQMDDILYFQKKLFRALNVPLNRLEQESQFSLGRSSEITRDEIKFSKFISRLRSKFSDLFYQVLKTQLLLKNIVTKEEWDELKENIKINFLRDNHFTEFKESEIIRERLNTLREIEEYSGKYFSKKWIQKNVLRQSEDDIAEIKTEIEEELKDPNEDNTPVGTGPDNNFGGGGWNNTPPPKPKPKPPAAVEKPTSDNEKPDEKKDDDNNKK